MSASAVYVFNMVNCSHDPYIHKSIGSMVLGRGFLIQWTVVSFCPLDDQVMFISTDINYVTSTVQYNECNENCEIVTL